MDTKIMTLPEYKKSVQLADIAARECAGYLLAGDLYQAKLCAKIYGDEQAKQNASSAAIQDHRQAQA